MQGRPGPPRSLSGLRPQKLSAVGEKKKKQAIYGALGLENASEREVPLLHPHLRERRSLRRARKNRAMRRIGAKSAGHEKWNLRSIQLVFFSPCRPIPGFIPSFFEHQQAKRKPKHPSLQVPKGCTSLCPKPVWGSPCLGAEGFDSCRGGRKDSKLRDDRGDCLIQDVDLFHVLAEATRSRKADRKWDSQLQVGGHTCCCYVLFFCVGGALWINPVQSCGPETGIPHGGISLTPLPRSG